MTAVPPVVTPEADTAPAHHRRIRSFVRREGRLTDGQARALEQLWPLYGIQDGAPVDPGAWFGREAPLVVEIGFGTGSALLSRAEAEPDSNFLGIEVHRPGVGALLKGVRDLGLDNVRVVDTDAVEFIERMLPPGSVDTFIIEFPDPWPKKKHHKRRLVQPKLVALLVSRLRPDGLLRLATDWAEYAEHMVEVLAAEPTLESAADDGGPYVPRPDTRPMTRFEARGLRLGHEVFDLAWRRRRHVG